MKLLRLLFTFSFLLLPSPSWAALSDNLISYWALDEASGTRADKVVASANTLTDNNTVTQGLGRVYSNAAQFTIANSESLSHADNASLSTTSTAFTIIGWINFDSAAVDQALYARDDGGTNRELGISYTAGSGLWRFRTWTGSGGSGFNELTATTAGAATAGNWYMVAVTSDLTTKKISINAGTQDSVGAANAGWNSGASLEIGTENGGRFMGGRIGPVIFWKRALSAAEITQVYNNYAGLTYEGILGTGIIIHPLTSGFTSVSTSATTASVTTTTNDLLLLTIVGSGTTNSALSTLSGLGLTWESVRAANWNTSGVPTRRIQVFRAMGNGATGSLTWTLTGSDGMAWSLIAFSNCQTGNNGADAIVQSASNMTNTVTSVSVTLSAFGDATNNVAFGAFGINTTGGITPGSGFVEIHDTTYTAPNAELQTQWKIGEDTGVDASFASSDDGAIGIEIKKATAGLSPALISAITEDVN